MIAAVIETNKNAIPKAIVARGLLTTSAVLTNGIRKNPCTANMKRELTPTHKMNGVNILDLPIFDMVHLIAASSNIVAASMVKGHIYLLRLPPIKITTDTGMIQLGNLKSVAHANSIPKQNMGSLDINK